MLKVIFASARTHFSPSFFNKSMQPSVTTDFDKNLAAHILTVADDPKLFEMCTDAGLVSGVGNPRMAPKADDAQAGMEGIAHMHVIAGLANASGAWASGMHTLQP